MNSSTRFATQMWFISLLVVCVASTAFSGCSVTSRNDTGGMPMLYRPLEGLSPGEIAQHSPSQSVDMLTEKLKRDPGNLSLLEDRGWSLARRGKYDEALADFKAVCTVEGSLDQQRRARLLCRVGITYYAMGKLPEAIDAFSLAIENDEENWELYFHRWLSFQAAGLSEEAAADRKKGLSLSPDVFKQDYSAEGGII